VAEIVTGLKQINLKLFYQINYQWIANEIATFTSMTLLCWSRSRSRKTWISSIPDW
jgi:hypothetical protein